MSTASQPGAAALPLALIAQAIPRLSRLDLEALTERLIETLDTLDGDPDLENYDVDLEEDDYPGVHDEDGCNLPCFKPDPNEPPLLKPKYGEDQTRGPFNEAHAHREWLQSQY